MRRGEAEDVCIRALSLAGISRKVIAEGLGRHLNHINRRCAALGVEKLRNVIEPLEGEVWMDRQDLGLRVSSSGRFVSLRTGKLLRVSKGRAYEYITVKVGTPEKTTRAVHMLVAECFGGAHAIPSKPDPWTPAEDAILKQCTTMAEAKRRLPARPALGIRRRAKRLGLKFQRSLAASGPVRGSVPFLDPLWAEAHAVVPRGLPQDVRDDLISELVLRRLEGGAADMRADLKVVMRDRAAMMGIWRETSLDAVIPGTDGLRRIDLLTSDAEHL